jgi:hypothetical protein
VFISGPGYLEYPWALETASRLKRAGAEVTVIDLSDFASPYAMRIKVLGIRLPVSSRRILRSIFLRKWCKIENISEKFCTEKGINYIRTRISRLGHIYSGMIQLDSLEAQEWGNLDSYQIIQSTLSSFEKRSLGPKEFVSNKLVCCIKFSVQQIQKELARIKQFKFDAAFLANGRKPTQAAITLEFRDSETEVILYEAGGGYIYPSFLKKRLDYFFTNPANSTELREKIMCESNFRKGSPDLAHTAQESVRNRSLIPYRLNHLTDRPSRFEKHNSRSGRDFAFFSTSEWEISILQNTFKTAIENNGFLTQIEAVQAIVDLLEEDDCLYLRLHPSDPGNHSEAETKWDIFKKNPKVIMFPTGSRINSCEIAENMDANFVWASFLGFELSLIGIPVAALGYPIYAACLKDNWIKGKLELQIFMSKPRPVSTDLLIYYSNYLAEDGFEIAESSTGEDRRVEIGNLKVDTARTMFKLLPKKWLAAVS